METRMVPVMELLGKQQRLGAVENLDALKANIGEYGFLAPVMLDRHYHIVAGCEQFLAAVARGAAFVPAVFEHQLDQDERIYVRGMLRSEVQSLNAHLPMETRLSGIVMPVIALQPSNADMPIVSRLLGNVTEVSFVQLRKALPPSSVIPS